MSKSMGSVTLHALFTAEDIGLGREAGVEHTMKVFLAVGDAVATRWIEMPNGILLLQSIADTPASGAIYLYDRAEQTFYLVTFSQGQDDSLTAREFEQLVEEYNLLWLVQNVARLQRATSAPPV